jgi:hypothetical protein
VTRLAVGGPFPDLRLETREGEVRLAERFGGMPLVVAFMRHFG